MIHRMGNGNGDGISADPLWWVLGGTVATIALYNLLQRSGAQAQVVYTKEPQVFSDLNAVAARLGRLRDLWDMGYISPDEAIGQLSGLVTSVSELQKAGKASPASVQGLTARIDTMLKDVDEYKKAMA
jgi:hypothetical protein